MDAMHDEMAPDHLLSSTRQLAISHSSPALPVPAGDHSPGHTLRSSQIDSTYPAVADAQPYPQAAAGARDGDDYYHHHQQYFLAASSSSCLALFGPPYQPTGAISELPNEIMLHILGYLDVNDLLSTSRTNHHLRHLSLSPILHHYRLRHTRAILPPLLSSPSRPSLAELIARSIFLTHTSVVSRRLARSLVSIRLSRRLASRPSAEALVERAVLPPECVPGMSMVQVAPALVAKRRAIEKEKVKDGLRKWVEGVWKGEVRQREEGIKKWEETKGVGRVWRLRRFWERMSRGDGVGLR
ncbi:F-box domain-containing protein [Colletotrichum orchidophilum]|uniref:F-box domain-containing protein n=1 Tax=Colletotrichum orchidophilum TaxID=1209926 RepID=A0A1G4ASU7_9PEZI|nr:F-box domain-containing protein [Colletotrichum orchidophilum]OHE92234.1 F-box domain-containing protein [Colletotrichum orchidophilum]